MLGGINIHGEMDGQTLPGLGDEQATLPKTTCKIVSKRRYVANVGKKTALSAVVFGFLIGAILAGLGTLGSLISLLVECDVNTIYLIVALASATGVCCYFVRCVDTKANAIPDVVPLTRANAADLPAPDSLVRASAEPMQAQEAVLLRAAAHVIDTPPEQLVRAVGVED